MEYSKYNYQFYSDKYGYLLYNAESNSFLTLNEHIFNKLSLLKDKKCAEDVFPPDLIKEFSKAKILVDPNDKSFYFKKKFHYYFHNFNNYSLGFAIAPTTGCNFRCPYCYELEKKVTFMSKDTEDDFVNFIKKFSSVKEVNITWYGGEPLLAFDNIKSILGKLRDENIQMNEHRMITNGFLLNEEKCKFFSTHPLNSIQITIDGSKSSHDKRRVLLNNGPTYDTIISNIDTFYKYNPNTNVNIRVNLDHSNLEDFYPLYTELMSRWKDQNLNIYPAFVRDYHGGCSTTCSLADRERRIKFYFELYEKYNVEVNFFPDFHIGGCGATNINYYVVGPEGELYKCWNDLGVSTQIVGYLNKDVIPNQDLLFQYLVGPSILDDAQCKECELFPVCDGGCQWLRLKNVNEKASHDLCTNRKAHMKEILEHHYEQRLCKHQ